MFFFRTFPKNVVLVAVGSVRYRVPGNSPCPCQILTQCAEHPKGKRFIRDVLGGDDLAATRDKWSSWAKMHIRIYGIRLVVRIERLPPMQTKVISGFHSTTPVAQMHSASELHLSQSSRSIYGQRTPLKQIPDEPDFLGKSSYVSLQGNMAQPWPALLPCSPGRGQISL